MSGIVGKGTDARTIPSWNQAQFANNALSSIATATDGIPSVTEESYLARPTQHGPNESLSLGFPNT